MNRFSPGSLPGLVKAVGFLLALGAVFGTALGVGYAVGPLPGAEEPAEQHRSAHAAEPTEPSQEDHSDAAGDDGAHTDQAEPAATTPGGLMVSQEGYRLQLSQPTAAAGHDVPVSFVIGAPDGEPLTSYDVEHEKRLHLIAVRRDFRGFQHVHPQMAEDGTWSTRLDLSPGPWRLFADFKPTGAGALTLGADLAVAGDYRPAPGGAEARTAEVDGYTVTLDGELAAGSDARLTLTVSKDGRPVTDLQPYLGAYGHLVALREGDLAYLHVHPDGHPGDGTTEPGPEVVFYAAVPSEGRYRLFLDFRHDGVVRTAEFVVDAGDNDRTGDADAPGHDDAEEGAEHGHD